MKKYTLIIGLIFSISSFAQEIDIELFATGISNPVNIKHAGDSRLFVLDRDGLIQIVNEKGDVNPTPFLDIRDQVSDGKDERGLLGLAFHPEYKSNGYFYINYINNDLETIIARFSRSQSDDQLADPKSELIFMTIPQPHPNHNGGELVFDKDGFLIIALGDGGVSGDRDNNAQNLETFLGKLLRIDVDNPRNGKHYGIPSDNPYFDDEDEDDDEDDELQEIWARGLRNPWKFSIDRVTNEMWIADVGENLYEEINKVSASTPGLNYGWRCYEANAPFNQNDCPDTDELIFPIAEYSHSDSGLFKCSITGGYRHRGTEQTSLNGIYFFADYCSSEIGMLKENGGNWTMSFSEPFKGNNWTTFGEDVNGELYIADITSGYIYKITDSTLGTDQSTLSKLQLYPNPVTDELTLNLGTSNFDISELSLYNIQGQLMKISPIVDGNSTKFSTKHLSKGLYILKVFNSEGQKTTRKFVKN